MCQSISQKTRLTRDCDTVEFFHHDTPFPKIKTIDFLHQAATDIVDILKNPPSTTPPSLASGDPVINELLTLATQLNNIDHIQENKYNMDHKKLQYTAATREATVPITKKSLNTEASPRVEKTPAAEKEATVPKITKSLYTDASPRVKKHKHRRQDYKNAVMNQRV